MIMWGRRRVGRLYLIPPKATGIKRMSYLLGGELMKAWLSFLATAVVCVSAFAQQPPPDVKQKVDSLIAKLRDAYVKNDAAAYARAFTSDGILVTLTGKVLRGQQEIEQATKMAISSLGGTKDLQVQTEELHALPDGTVWYIGNAKLSVTRKKSKTIIL